MKVVHLQYLSTRHLIHLRIRKLHRSTHLKDPPQDSTVQDPPQDPQTPQVRPTSRSTTRSAPFDPPNRPPSNAQEFEEFPDEQDDVIPSDDDSDNISNIDDEITEEQHPIPPPLPPPQDHRREENILYPHPANLPLPDDDMPEIIDERYNNFNKDSRGVKRALFEKFEQKKRRKKCDEWHYSSSSSSDDDYDYSPKDVSTVINEPDIWPAVQLRKLNARRTEGETIPKFVASGEIIKPRKKRQKRVIEPTQRKHYNLRNRRNINWSLF